jgi:type IV pilus assembly protein PilA
MGVSSVPDGAGYFRNRMFLYTGGERHGLLAGLGGKPGPFTHVNLAPADAAFYAESEMDLPVIYRSIKEVIAKVGGESASSQFEASLKKAGEAAALSVLDLIYGLKGHSAIVLRLDATKTLRLPVPPSGVVLPSFALLICVDGIAPVVETALAKSPLLRRTNSGTLHVYESMQPLPLEGIQPVLVADGSTLYLATSRAFLDECRTQKTSLAQSAEFQRSLAHVGSEGNGLSYVSPRLFTQLRQIEQLNPGLPADSKSMVSFVLSRLPTPSEPLVAVRTNLPDGVLVRSYMNRSLKQDVMMISVYNPVMVGLLAAMAIPAFQKVRMASQEKAVLNNLRMLAAAADQHYLENGVTTASYSDLVGPTRYIKVLNSVAGEDYRALRFRQGQTLRVRLPDGRTVEYTP